MSPNLRPVSSRTDILGNGGRDIEHLLPYKYLNMKATDLFLFYVAPIRFNEEHFRWWQCFTKQSKGNENNIILWIFFLLLALVLLWKIFKSIKLIHSPLHGEHLLDERHTVHESHLSSQQLHKLTIWKECQSHILCPIPHLLVLHGVDHPLLPVAPVKPHYLLLLG